MLEGIVVIGLVLGAAVLALRAIRRALDSTALDCSCGFECTGTELLSCHGTIVEQEARTQDEGHGAAWPLGSDE